MPWWSTLPWLHRLPQPTLVLAGDDDPIVPLINGRILARRIRGARLHVVRGGGHLFLLEEADEMAAVVAEFLAEPGLSVQRDGRASVCSEGVLPALATRMT